MTGEPIRFMYVDNDPLAAGALAALVDGAEGIELVVVTPRETGAELCEAFGIHRPDVVMIDLYLDPRGDDGVALAAALATAHPDAVIAICTSSESPTDAARAWAAGIPAYVTKRALLRDLDQLPVILRSIADGHVLYHVDPRLEAAAASPLSKRELEVLALKAAGETHRAIADQLCVSVRTVDSHVANIRAKLEAPSVADMLRMAADRGLIEPPR